MHGGIPFQLKKLSQGHEDHGIIIEKEYFGLAQENASVCMMESVEFLWCEPTNYKNRASLACQKNSAEPSLTDFTKSADSKKHSNSIYRTLAATPLENPY